jgi:transcriptional regulator with XRE-family HTH domain
MNLAEKMKHLRAVEGELRELKRPMTQVEVVRAMQEELGESISQAYLSQLESSKRLHLTASSRDLLARFFKVHPGYLVNDPADYSTHLFTALEQDTDHLHSWLIASAAKWHTEPVLQDVLRNLADSQEPRRYFEVFRELMRMHVEDLEAIVTTLEAAGNDAYRTETNEVPENF